MDQPILDFISYLTMGLLTVAIPVGVALVAYQVRQGAARLKGELGDQVLAILNTLAVAAVHAAEQAKLKDYLVDKKTHAVNAVQKGLNDLGLKGISVETISSFIEAAVFTEFNYGREPVKTGETAAG